MAVTGEDVIDSLAGTGRLAHDAFRQRPCGPGTVPNEPNKPRECAVSKRFLVLSVASALLSGCNANLGNLLGTVLNTVLTPTASSSATPAAAASAAAALSAVTGVSTRLSVNGQTATIVQTVKSTLTAIKTTANASQYTGRWELGTVTTDGAYLVVVSMVAGKPFNSLDIAPTDLAGLTIEVTKSGSDLFNQTQSFGAAQMNDSGIAMSVSSGKLNVAFKARTSGLGTPADVQLDVKGLPTS